MASSPMPPRRQPDSIRGDASPEARVVDARFVCSFAALSQAPPGDRPEVAFAGRSNVGKSSLLNVLMMRRNLARTSSTPGCTRQINVFEARLADGLVVRLSDLPGFGYAQRSKAERRAWQQVVEEYLASRSALRMVFVLLDARRGVQAEELGLRALLREIRPHPLPLVGVLTKVDKVPRSRVRGLVADVRAELGESILPFSAPDGLGREPIWREIRRVLASPCCADAASLPPRIC